MSLGARLRKLREVRRLSQNELAQRAEVDQAIISRLEAEKQHNVRSDALLRFAEVLGCTTDYLVGRFKEEESEVLPAGVALAGT